MDKIRYIKAILRLFIYKALYDQSYLGSKTTMTTGEWSCLISFAWYPLTCSERRGGSEKIQNEKYMSPAGFEPTPRNDTTSGTALKTARLRYLDENLAIYVLLDRWIKLLKPLRDNTGQSDCGYIIHVVLN